MTRLHVQNVQIGSLKPYASNPRRNASAIDAVAASIKAFGFRQPIVVDCENVIICGHTRWLAAKKLDLDSVPVHVATNLSEDQVRAYRIADNQTANLAEWDTELLPAEIAELRDDGVDLNLLGFSTDELASILNEEAELGLTDPDAIPEPPDAPVTQRGDLWLLGDHRLLCGDSADVGDVDRLVGEGSVQLINTDPPYNVKVEPRSNNAMRTGNTSFGSKTKRRSTKKLRAKDRPLANDFLDDEAFADLLQKWFGNLSRVLEPGRSFYVWGGFSNCGNYPKPLADNDLYFSQAIIWHKQHPVITRKDFMGDHEWCFYGWKTGAAHSYFGPNNATDVWSIKKVAPQSMVHLTEKPVELAVRAINYSSRMGDRVLDLFGGSGSTLIACEQTDRRALLMELDPMYADVIVERWQDFTGKKAKRHSKGKY